MSTPSPAPAASATTSAPGRAVVVPDKPALEGLEATWSQRWKQDDTYAFDRSRERARRLLHRHPAPDRLRVAARRARVLLHPHRPGRPLPADAGQVGLLPDGLGRQRPAHRAAGAELLRRAVRPVAALRGRLRAARQARREAPGPDQPPQLHRAVRAARRAGRGRLRVAVAHAGPLGGLEPALHDHRPQGADRRPSARSCATSPGGRPTCRRRRPCGTSRSRPRSRRPS